MSTADDTWKELTLFVSNFSLEDAYLLLNLTCLSMVTYCLFNFARGKRPAEKKEDLTIITPYAFTHWWLRLLLTLSGLAQRWLGIKMFAIPVEKLMELARNTPREAAQYFGNQATTIELFETVLQDLNRNPHLSLYGRFYVHREISQSLVARKAFMEYIVRHAKTLLSDDNTVRAPIVITGLPRTGMTLLQNLLACDPKARAPIHYETDAGAYVPCAPPTPLRENTAIEKKEGIMMMTEEDRKSATANHVRKDHPFYHRSIRAWYSRFHMLPEQYAALIACRYDNPESIADDSILAEHLMPSLKYTPILGDTAREALLTLTNRSNVYAYMVRYLQLLQHHDQNHFQQPNGGHWVLKSHLHASHLPLLYESFPDARVVVCHRDVKSIVPSNAGYLLRQIHPCFKGTTKRSFGYVAMESAVQTATAMMHFREKIDRGNQQYQMADLYYDEWMQDPIAAVKSLYAQWNMTVSSEMEEKMKAYLKDHPQGKHGSFAYNMAEFGLSESAVDAAFVKYVAKQPWKELHAFQGNEIPAQTEEAQVPQTA